MYKEGSRDTAMVKQIQEIVNTTIDGIWGPKTTAAVIRYQSLNNLVADGIVGPQTLEVMGILDTDNKSHTITTEDGLVIEKYFLPNGEYIKKDHNILNDYLFLHHTAGGANPYRCIDHWGRDSRGRVATEFVLGGQDIRNGNDTYDGTLLQAFPEGCQGWHLGGTNSYYMNRHSVGVEICSFGCLSGDHRSYTGVKAAPDQVSVLDEPFRRRKYWHKYSDKQIKVLEDLILYIATRDNIDIREGLIKWIKDEGPIKAFEFKEDACAGKVKGLLTHTNVRKTKMDCFPQQELIDMLLSL